MTVNIEYDTEKALDLDYKKIIESKQYCINVFCVLWTKMVLQNISEY